MPAPIYFNVFFHGPWAFWVDVQNGDPKKGMIYAYTPDCRGHVYLMGEDSDHAQIIGGGTYRLQVQTAVADGGFDWNTVTTSQMTASKSGRLVPPQPDDARVRCAFQFPLTAMYPVLTAQRGAIVANHHDSLLSGRHFRLLPNNATFPVAQALGFSLLNANALRLTNGTDSWSPKPPAAGATAINLRITAKSVHPGTEDHFAMMADIFGYDLHLDGDRVMQGADQGALPPGSGVGDLDPLALTVQHPIVCGGNLIVFAPFA